MIAVEGQFALNFVRGVLATVNPCGFVLLPKRWVVERTFGWLARFRRLARDYERLTQTLKQFHWLAFLSLLLARLGLGCA